MPRLVHCLAALALCASLCVAQPARDKDLASKLVGTWVVPPQQYHDSPGKAPQVGSVMKSGARTFRADGTFEFSAVLTVQGRDIPLHDEGTWRVDDGVLIEEITKCDQPEIVPIGTVTKDTLVSVTDTEYRFRTKDGQERYRIRKRD